jgi:hypothetical protein
MLTIPSAFIKEAGLEVRFSTEDSFRSNLVDVLSVYSAVDKIGVNRVGIAGESWIENLQFEKLIDCDQIPLAARAQDKYTTSSEH